MIVSEEFQLKKNPKSPIFCQNCQIRQFGAFWPKWQLNKFFFYFLPLGAFRYIRKSQLGQIWVPGQPQAPPGMPDKSARIATVKELQPSIAAQNTNELKIQPHLEAVADIEKPIIFPYSTYKLGLNGLCNTSGAFCSSKTVYFWGVRNFPVICKWSR